MASGDPTKPVAVIVQPPLWQRIVIAYGPWLSLVVVTALISLITKTPQPLPPPPSAEVIAQAVADKLAPQVTAAATGATAQAPETDHVKAFGWVSDPEEVERTIVRAAIPKFADTPAGKAAMGDDDTPVYLWQAVRKAAGKPATWYPNINQLSVGCCVGCGWKHSVDVAQAVQIVLGGRAAEWKAVSVEVIYGLSRVQIGGGRIRGDGSVGAWAADGVRGYGVCAMMKYPFADLSTFIPARARSYGAKGGMPVEFEKVAKEHPVKTTANVRTWADVNRSIRQGYPVAVCSSVGFDDPNGSPGTRDADGFCRQRGTWPHCMCLIAVRGGARPGAFCLNSWGDEVHKGPTWPADAPRAGFWIDADVVGRMVGEGDSFALSDVTGFPARELNWVAKALPDPVPGDQLAGVCVGFGERTAAACGLVGGLASANESRRLAASFDRAVEVMTLKP